MEVFVSYSRRDGDIVRRIVDRLETAGHSVWIDTDDIRGSEPWRAAIAQAIADADVVVLVISPDAMRSVNVEREVTVAADADRRIVPVVVAAADIPVGFQYALAGLQRISFEGRPFDEAVGELQTAIESQDAPRAPTPPPPTPPRPTTAGPPIRTPSGRAPARRRASLVTVLALALATVGGIALVRRDGTRDDEPVVPPTTGDRSPAATSPPSNPETAQRRLDATVWFAGYTIAATEARFDADRGSLAVDLTFTNEQYGSAQPCGLFLEDVALVVNGAREMLFGPDCAFLPPGTSTRATVTADIDELDLDDAVLEFGTPRQHQATIPLDGTAATGETPSSGPVTGESVTTSSSFTAERVDVVPAACDGLSDRLTFAPADRELGSIVVTGSVTSTDRYPINYGFAVLTTPDGTRVASDSLNGAIYAVDPGATIRDVRACFTVPWPVAGRYLYSSGDSLDEMPVPFEIDL